MAFNPAAKDYNTSHLVGLHYHSNYIAIIQDESKRVHYMPLCFPTGVFVLPG